MRFNIITNLSNGVGLEREYRILEERLREAGHESRGIQFNAPVPADAQAEVNLFDEVLVPEMFPLATRQWIMIHAEWFFPPWTALLDKFEKVIVKTRDAERLMRQYTKPGQLIFTGFESRDLYDPSIAREPIFLHVAGRSDAKNTKAILEAWREIRGWKLTVISERRAECPAWVTWRTRTTDNELQTLMNRCRFHLMPSAYEGFGHSLHEGLGCGAVILTTDAEPMRSSGDHCPEGLIPVSEKLHHHLAQYHIVSSDAVREAVERVVKLPKDTLEAYSVASRNKFVSEKQEFRARFRELLR